MISDSKKAFTLLEVVVALAILSSAMIAIFSTLRMCAGASQHGRMLTQAVLLAESRLTEFSLEENPAYKTQSGVAGSFGWQIEVVPTEIENLAAVKTSITWSEQKRPQQYELVSLKKMKTFTQNND